MKIVANRLQWFKIVAILLLTSFTVYCIEDPTPSPLVVPPQSEGRITARISSTSDKENGEHKLSTPQTLFKYYFGAELASKLVTPCTFPTPNEPHAWETKCSVLDPVRKYNICDPESSTYYSGMDPLLKMLDDIQKKHGDQCVCTNTTGPRCWYKFAFAFLDTLRHPALPLNDIDVDELCNLNVTVNGLVPMKTSPSTWESRQALMTYGNRFAELLRKRWRSGTCGQDVLILIIKHAPEVLNSNKNGGAKPIFFVSYGDTVKQRTEHITKPQNFHIKSMMEAVELANEMLQGHGENSTLEKALVILVSWYEQLLTLADQTYHKYNPKFRGVRSHIPPTWALGAFAGCAVLLVVMGLGSCLVRTRVRRGGMRSKQGGGENRRWKAGFVGGMFLRKGAKEEKGAGRNGDVDARILHRPSYGDMTHLS